MSVIDVLNKILGDPNKKELKKIWPIVGQVRALQASPAVRALTLETLPKKTQEFRDHIQAELAKGKELKTILNALLPEAFAVAIRGGASLVHGVQMLEHAHKKGM
jgi:preprotein translocase subunit SecA